MHAFAVFLDRLQDHYLWLLGLVLMAEPLLDALWGDYQRFADRYVSRKTRTRVSWAIVMASAIIACFLAFADQLNQTQVALGERNEARQQRDTNVSPSLDRMSGDLLAARGQIDAQAKQIKQQETEISSLTSRYASRHLLSDEKKIIQQVAKTPDGESYSISVFQPSDCSDCNEYSTEFIETLTAPSVGWKVTQFNTMHGGINAHFRGIALLVKDPKNPPKAALALAAALSSAKIQFKGGPSEGSLNVPDGEVGLVIGPKEGR